VLFVGGGGGVEMGDHKYPFNTTFLDQKVAQRGFAQYTVTTVPDPRAVRGMNSTGYRTPAATICYSQVTTPIKRA